MKERLCMHTAMIIRMRGQAFTQEVFAKNSRHNKNNAPSRPLSWPKTTAHCELDPIRTVFYPTAHLRKNMLSYGRNSSGKSYMLCYALIRLTLHQFFPKLQRLNLAKPLHFQKKQIGFTPRFRASIQAQPIFCKDMLKTTYIHNKVSKHKEYEATQCK